MNETEKENKWIHKFIWASHMEGREQIDKMTKTLKLTQQLLCLNSIYSYSCYFSVECRHMIRGSKLMTYK